MSTEEWVTMTDAALKLGTTPSTVSRICKNNNQIKTKKDPLDKRVRLVDFKTLRELWQSSYRYQP